MRDGVRERERGENTGYRDVRATMLRRWRRDKTVAASGRRVKCQIRLNQGCAVKCFGAWSY